MARDEEEDTTTYPGRGPSRRTMLDLELRALLRKELETGLPLDRAPVLRICLIRLDEERWVFARSHHHVLLDAWCLSLLLVDFLAYYEAWLKGPPLPNKKVTPYREYLKWLQRQDIGAAEVYWRESLQGFSAPTYTTCPPSTRRPPSPNGSPR